jgi:hypothetical protein
VYAIFVQNAVRCCNLDLPIVDALAARVGQSHDEVFGAKAVDCAFIDYSFEQAIFGGSEKVDADMVTSLLGPDLRTLSAR